MILRKPYAFLIKHFKLIHLILAILSFYSIYRTKILLDFFNEYVANMVNVIGQDLTTNLIPGFYIFVPILIILITVIVLVVMVVKKKPNLFYIINIAVCIFVFIITLTANSTLETMSRSLIDARTARLVRDFVMLSFMSQFITIPVIMIRTIGFDIRKFNFKEDLKELEISDEDREEFEVQLNFDKNKTIRNIRKAKRYFKYTYKENRILFNTSILGVLLGIVILVVVNIFTKTPVVDQNTIFAGNGFNISVLDSYLVNTDYEGNIIKEDYYYLILKIKVKNNSTTPKVLDTATTKLEIGAYYYIPILEYKERFFDLGTLYQNEKIGNEYEEKILAYEIPKQLVNNEMIFSYVNKNSFTDKEGFKSTKVRINYNDLTGIDSNEKNNINEQLQFIGSIMEGYKLTISSYEINDKFKINYNYCISNECFTSSEYLMPNLNTNYDKTLLKITGNLEKGHKVDGIYDLYDFIESFGKICYNVNGVLKTQNLKLKEITSTKVKKTDKFYIEVPSEIKEAENISIIFTIRDRIYEYVLK